MDQLWLRKAVVFLHYLCPLLIIVYFGLAQSISTCASWRSQRHGSQGSRAKLVLWLVVGVVFTYVGETILLLIQYTTFPERAISRDGIFYALSSSFIWSIQAYSLVGFRLSHWYSYYGSWGIALVVDILLAASEHKLRYPTKMVELFRLGFQIIRITDFTVLLVMFFSLRTPKEGRTKFDEESQTLLPGKGSSQIATEADNNLRTYGTLYARPPTDNLAKRAGETQEVAQRTSLATEQQAWQDVSSNSRCDVDRGSFAQGLWTLISLVWPSKNSWLQISFVIVGLCVVAGRALNLLILRQVGIIVDELGSHEARVPWMEIGLYVLYRWLDSNAGIGLIKRLFWIPVEQYSYTSIATVGFAHLIELPGGFSEDGSAKETLEPLNHGRTIMRLMHVGILETMPMIVDLLLVIGYLWYLFDAFMGLTLVLVIVLYLWMTTRLHATDEVKSPVLSTGAHRDLKSTSEVTNSWHDAPRSNLIGYRTQRYLDAVKGHMRTLQSSRASYAVLLAVQSLVISIGLLAVCFITAKQVAEGQKSIGSLVILLTYWLGLSGSLYSVGLYLKSFRDGLPAAAHVLELLRTNPAANDTEGAKLQMKVGEVFFDSVSFGCQSSDFVLKGVSFRAKPGQRVAFISHDGREGPGLISLLTCSHDASSGSILIDGQDVQDITPERLKEQIELISENPVLLEDSFINNVRHARISATDQEVVDACHAAGIHDTIISLPNGYGTSLGGQALKPSAVELQQISIARAFLKDPKIILIDESAGKVDSGAKYKIRDAIDRLSKDRITFINALQPSTIAEADQIIVFRDGRVIEQINHAEPSVEEGTHYRPEESQHPSEAPKNGEDCEPLEHGSRIPQDQDQEQSKELNEHHMGADWTGLAVAAAMIDDHKTSGLNTENSRPEQNGAAVGAKNISDPGIADESLQAGDKTEKRQPTWKPDAPAFVPRHLRAFDPTTSQSSEIDTLSADVGSRERKEEENEARKDQALMDRGQKATEEEPADAVILEDEKSKQKQLDVENGGQSRKKMQPRDEVVLQTTSPLKEELLKIDTSAATSQKSQKRQYRHLDPSYKRKNKSSGSSASQKQGVISTEASMSTKPTKPAADTQSSEAGKVTIESLKDEREPGKQKANRKPFPGRVQSKSEPTFQRGGDGINGSASSKQPFRKQLSEDENRRLSVTGGVPSVITKPHDSRPGRQGQYWKKWKSKKRIGPTHAGGNQSSSASSVPVPMHSTAATASTNKPPALGVPVSANSADDNARRIAPET